MVTGQLFGCRIKAQVRATCVTGEAVFLDLGRFCHRDWCMSFGVIIRKALS